MHFQQLLKKSETRPKPLGENCYQAEIGAHLSHLLMTNQQEWFVVAHITDKKGLFAMWVDPQFRRASVAKTLIQNVIEWAKANGSPSLFLGVSDNNLPVIKLYARHGFLPTGKVSTLPPLRTHVLQHEQLLLFSTKI